jgi:hypothetical protein
MRWPATVTEWFSTPEKHSRAYVSWLKQLTGRAKKTSPATTTSTPANHSSLLIPFTGLSLPFAMLAPSANRLR